MELTNECTFNVLKKSLVMTTSVSVPQNSASGYCECVVFYYNVKFIIFYIKIFSFIE